MNEEYMERIKEVKEKIVKSKADRAEISAFRGVSKLLKKNAGDGYISAFSKPSGSDVAFPDFGFSLNIEGKVVDIHIEYKLDYKAQMGSMRDWFFENGGFSTPDINNENKQTLIELMNSDISAKQAASNLLESMKLFYDPSVNKVYSGVFAVKSIQTNKRQEKISEFKEAIKSGKAPMKNFQIAIIENSILGQKIDNHYKKKFHNSIRNKADYSILLLMIGDAIWYMHDDGNPTKDIRKKVSTTFGLDNIPELPPLVARLEVRTSAREKKGSLDTLASFRLANKPSGGAKIV